MEIAALILSGISIGTCAVLAAWVSKLNLRRKNSEEEIKTEVKKNSEILRKSKA